MHEWLEALRKSAKAASSGVSADEVRRAETECGVPFPEDLGHLYLTFDGGELHGDVSLFPLHGHEGSVSVLEKTRLKLVGLPAAGVWRIGMKGPHRHLFSARKSAMVEQGDGGGPLPGWVDALGEEDWLYGTWDSEKREMRLYRSLKDMLDVLVPPAEVESFGERTFARAMNAVLQEALSGMSGEEEQAEEASTEEEDTGAQRELAYEYDEDVSRGRRGGAQDESGGFGRFGAKSGGGKKPASRSSVTQAELFVRPTMQEALRKELGPETAKKPAVKSKASKPVATIAETVKDAVAKPVAQVAEAVKDAVSKPAKATKTAVTKLVDAAATATTKTVAKAVEVTQPKAKPAAQPVTETSAVLPATKSPSAKSATKSLATAKPGAVKSATQPSVAKTPAPAKSAATKPAVVKAATQKSATAKSAAKPAVAKPTTKQAAAKKSATTAKPTTRQAAAKKSATTARPTTKQAAAKKSATTARPTTRQAAAKKSAPAAKSVGNQLVAKKSAGKSASKKAAATKPAKKSAGAKPTGTKPARKSAPSKAAAKKSSAKKGAGKKPKSKR
ncbi:SMI1/KNR4 family protein [Myxococcus fulvus]|uniref:SMI1/KNR4 family protein n=1 Tax=Myxococcus fulvus TaxID=33 RepID=UPI0020BDA19B|nr:SMI1/KNR4 family protein [Myxococcus fulvus]MCK8500870.1 hypothetical protein [Myxococcus fulvus]